MRSKLIVIAALVAITMLIVHAAATVNNEDLISLTEGAYTGYVGMKHTIAWEGSDDSRFKNFEDAPSETQITTDPSDQKNPAISGDYVVWQDYRTGVDIYMYDLSTRTEAQITTDPAYQWGADISRDRIVWHDLRNGEWDIYMYDISTGTETQITTDPDPQWNPAIYGDRIVYENNSEYIYADDIYVYNLSTGTETQITAIYSDKWSIDIYGDRIVWMDSRNGNWDIYMYDISTGTETQITTSTLESQTPAIYGDRIVWADFRNGNGDIYMYDISTGTETQITTDPDHQWNPAIYGDRIVWADLRNGNGDIYMYDISTGTEAQITTDPATQVLPAISRDCIVWNDDRNGNLDIYMYTIGATTDPFYYYPTTTFPGEKTELTVIVKLTEITMNIGDPVQWYITKPGGETITGESDTLKCCRVGGLYDTAFYDFPDYGMYTIRVEFPGYVEYAEWDVEVWGPTGVIIGEVTNPTDDPIENVDVYLYAAEDEYKVLDFIDEWRSDPTTSVPSYISSTKTGSTGNYQLAEIIPGSYLVLAVPQADLGYSPISSVVFSIKKDETEIIDLELTPKYLNFDNVMGAIKADSKNIVDEDTRAAAEVYVKGWEEFTEHELPENIFWSAVGGITSAIEIYRGDPKTVGLAVTKLAEELGVTLIGIPLLEEAAKVQWQKEGPGNYELAKEAAMEIKNLNWMRDFDYAAEGVDVAEEEGYIKRTNIYPETVTSIDSSFEDYLDLTYQEPAEGFDSSEVKAILQQQEEMLRCAKGFVITPQGNISNLKETIIHKGGYKGAKTISDTAGLAGKASTCISTAGLAISIGTSWTVLGVGAGALVSGFGAVGGLASATIETTAIELMADEWGNTQLYWAKDLGDVQEVNRDIVKWLDKEMQHPTDFKNINGEIVNTDLHPDPLIKWLFGINVIEPNEPWFSPIKVFALNDEDVVVRNTGSIDDVSILILNYNYLLDGTTCKHGGVVRSTLDAGESKSITLPYMSEFILPFTMEHHFLQTILWADGKIEQKTDEYIVVGDIDWILDSPSPLASNLATETSVQDIKAKLLKQPMRSNSYALSTSNSNSPITLEEWVRLVGNCTKIISTTIDPVNDSIQVKYNTTATTKNITFFMTTIPGSHLNIHVYDELGRHVGYFPATDSDQIQIPNATYTGNISNPEIILVPNAASKNYTIKVDATQFTTSSPIPVEVYAIETPVRPAVLGISPVVLYPFISPGDTENITMQLAEVGQQEDIEGVTILQHEFTDKFGNTIPDVTANLSQNNFDISAGNTTYLTITINVPGTITLPDLPETRYTANITIETLNAGSINSSIHLLVLDTDLTNAKLTFAELNVIGVHLAGIDLSGINETYKPAEAIPESAYMINSTGTGNFTLQFTDIPNANTTRAYKINATKHWIELNATTTTDTVTFTMEVENLTVVLGSISRSPTASFTYTPENPIVTQTITFNASNSTDYDGYIVDYEWNFGDGNITNTTESIINHSYALAGNYMVNLTVTDDAGSTNTSMAWIAVSTMPDLAITENWVCWPDNCTICYNLTNIGNGTAPAGHNTTLFVDNVETASDPVAATLEPNESYTGCFDGYNWTYTPPSDNITVCAECNNTVAESNETNNCMFNTWRCGDVDGNGIVNVMDARLLMNHVANPTGYPVESWTGDVDGDGDIDGDDVQRLLAHVFDPEAHTLNCN